MQTLVHYFLHLGFPVIIAYVFFRKNWQRAYLLLLATMLVDLDHLLANPVFQANRCSIGFHALHTSYAMIVYILFMFFPAPWRILGIGLLFHMLTDFIDCLFIFHQCPKCLSGAAAQELIQSVTNWLGRKY